MGSISDNTGNIDIPGSGHKGLHLVSETVPTSRLSEFKAKTIVCWALLGRNTNRLWIKIHQCVIRKMIKRLKSEEAILQYKLCLLWQCEDHLPVPCLH